MDDAGTAAEGTFREPEAVQQTRQRNYKTPFFLPQPACRHQPVIGNSCFIWECEALNIAEKNYILLKKKQKKTFCIDLSLGFCVSADYAQLTSVHVDPNKKLSIHIARPIDCRK